MLHVTTVQIGDAPADWVELELRGVKKDHLGCGLMNCHICKVSEVNNLRDLTSKLLNNCNL